MKKYLGSMIVLAGLLLGQNGSDPWTAAQVMKPEELAKLLPGKPVLIHVGFAPLYRQRHIPGSVYAGPGSRDTGIDELKKAVANIPKDKQIVLYCGCCPWTQCPNMRPAFRLLKEMGYTQVRAVEIPTNLKTDWTDKGYPVEEGGSAQ